MTFLQPYILWGLPLLLIPVIIHLVNRLRHRPQPWAAMRFLRSATQSSISQAKLRQFLVLLFRVLAVLALIFFLGRPLAGGWLGWALSPAPEVVILVLDRSPSMEALAGAGPKTSREQAVDLWSEALRQFEGASRVVLIDNTSPAPQELPAISALQDANFTGPTDASATLTTLLQRAYQYLIDSRSGAAEVWIASDLQQTSWNPDDGQWERLRAQFGALPQKVRFRLLSFEPPARNNVALTLADALRRTRGEQSQLEITLNIEQTQAAAGPAILKTIFNGAESETRIELSGTSMRWRNTFPLGNATNSGWGSFTLASDGNNRDNQVFFAYEPEQHPAALVVSTELTSNRPLRLAASDLSQDPLAPARQVAPENFAGAALTNLALVIWSAPLPEGLNASLLEQFVGSGGAAVFLPGAQPGGSFAGLGWGQIVRAASNQVFSVTKWNELDGPLARTEEGFGVPVGQLEVYQRASISGQGTVLATFADGAPFLVRKAAGKGEVYFCATSVQPEWSSLAEGPVLVPMLQRMLLNGSRRLNSAVLLTCEEIAGRDTSAWSPLEAAAAPADPHFQAGLYQVNGRITAVNRSAAESQLERVPAEIVRGLFAGLSFQLHQETSRGTDRLQGEVWRLFLFLMLLFLIVEGLLVLPPANPEAEPVRPPAGSSRPKEALA